MTYFLPILAVLLGFSFVLITKPQQTKNIKLLLAFSGAFLLSLTIFELLPEVYNTLNTKKTGLFIILGILLQIFLEFFSKGAEHGHVHLHNHNKTFPWLLFISLSIHAILEGFPIHQHDNLVYGIVIHKIPIAIILTTFFLQAKINKNKIVIFLVLFSLMTPLGSFLATWKWTAYYSQEINALVIGILLHVSTTILFESSENHTFNFSKILMIIIGIATGFFL